MGQRARADGWTGAGGVSARRGRRGPARATTAARPAKTMQFPAPPTRVFDAPPTPPTAPFDAAAVFLAIGGVVIMFSWTENKGDNSDNTSVQQGMKQAYEAIKNDKKV